MPITSQHRANLRNQLKSQLLGEALLLKAAEREGNDYCPDKGFMQKLAIKVLSDCDFPAVQNPVVFVDNVTNHLL